MKYFLLAGGLAAAVLMLWVLKYINRQLRRKRLLQTPFPPEWVKILEKNVSLYRFIPPRLKKELHGLIQIFLAEKNIEGAGSLPMTDEIRVTIALGACLLLLNRKTRLYPKLSTVFVYPDLYVARETETIGEVETEKRSVRAGESWRGGPLVLAWDEARKNAQSPEKGRDVVLHEFAHQLDEEDGHVDGAPRLGKSSSYRSWARILRREYKRLKKESKSKKKGLLDNYGSSEPAEFFAVATETFYTRPREFKKEKPALYGELRKYYRVDPAEWLENIPGSQ